MRGIALKIKPFEITVSVLLCLFMWAYSSRPAPGLPPSQDSFYGMNGMPHLFCKSSMKIQGDKNIYIHLLNTSESVLMSFFFAKHFNNIFVKWKYKVSSAFTNNGLVPLSCFI
jgi:hypothetical protein